MVQGIVSGKTHFANEQAASVVSAAGASATGSRAAGASATGASATGPRFAGTRSANDTVRATGGTCFGTVDAEKLYRPYLPAVLRYVQKLANTHQESVCMHAAQRVLPAMFSTQRNHYLHEQLSRTYLRGKHIVSAYWEAYLRCAIASVLSGLCVGLIDSPQSAAIGACSGLVLHVLLWKNALKKAQHQKAQHAEKHLSEMLEVLSLGLKSGLTFDVSFKLYASNFSVPFARDCLRAYDSWAYGMQSRSQALQALSSAYGSRELQRVVTSIIRSLHLGNALAATLHYESSVCREKRCSQLEKQVLKAPIKMMIPTGAFILPAMLILIMAPMILSMT